MADHRWRDERRGWDEEGHPHHAREAARGPGDMHGQNRYQSDYDRSRGERYGYAPGYRRGYGARDGDFEGEGFRGAYGQPDGGRGYEQYRGGTEPGWGGDGGNERYRAMESALGQPEGGRGYEQYPRSEAGRQGHAGRGPKGYVRSDERIREDVCERLTYDPDVDASDIEVSVSDCEVTLAGTVASRHEKRRAEDCAEGIRGVRDVRNNLRIEPRTGEAAETGAAPGGVRASGSGAIRS